MQSLQYFVSDYDLKKSVKTFFFKKPTVFALLQHIQRFILDRSQLRNQEEGSKGALAPFSRVIEKI